ncbi:MAG TPA: hypothetical protein VFE02_15415, partial [Candidatus Acidoferrales bacterium]|nr:hypothetical protein [Candidatus Acidoferrales bacterium]
MAKLPGTIEHTPLRWNIGRFAFTLEWRNRLQVSNNSRHETSPEAEMNLPKRPLGSSGLQISAVGFGAWAIGGGGWAFSWG